MFTEKFRQILNSVPHYDDDDLPERGSPRSLSYATRLNMALHILISDRRDRISESGTFRSYLSRQGRTNGVFEQDESHLVPRCPTCGNMIPFNVIPS